MELLEMKKALEDNNKVLNLIATPDNPNFRLIVLQIMCNEGDIKLIENKLMYLDQEEQIKTALFNDGERRL